MLKKNEFLRLSISLLYIMESMLNCNNIFANAKPYNNPNYSFENITNYTSADELIINNYSDKELSDMSSIVFPDINEQIEMMPPECIRTNDDSIYFIYKSNTGHYAFLLYSLADNTKSYWYCGKHLRLKDFSSLYDKKTNLQDIETLDPCGDYIGKYVSHYEGIFTNHITCDGYSVTIDFQYNGSEYAINTMTISDAEIFTKLLPIDKILLHEHMHSQIKQDKCQGDG